MAYISDFLIRMLQVKYPDLGTGAAQWGLYTLPKGRPGPAGTQWNSSVLADVRKLEFSPVGVSLLKAIRYRRPIIVVPNNNTGLNRCNAFGGGSVRHLVEDNVTITPADWPAPGAVAPSCSTVNGPGSASDEILFHELVHVVRAESGEFKALKLTGGMANYTNEEEFFAVLITNLYISSRGGRALRHHHRGFQQLPAPQDTSAGFLAVPDNARLIRKIIYQNTTWLLELSRINIPFNPIREFVQHDKKMAFLRRFA